MQIAVIGSGYVGLVTATCLADSGNHVVAVDSDAPKIEALQRGHCPFFEPGLEELVQENSRSGRLRFATDTRRSTAGVRMVFLAVGTPPRPDGSADMSAIESAALDVACGLTGPAIVVTKSTVPVGTGARLEALIAAHTPHRCPVVSNPEFLKEGSALSDFLRPDRVVIGADDPAAGDEVAELHEPFVRNNKPILRMSRAAAELTKYAANAYLATRISFINEIANICEMLGADAKEVAQGMGYDKRIGHHFLESGVGYGGSCFPKDVKALAYMAQIHGTHPQLLQAVMDINVTQRRHIVLKLQDELGTLKDKAISLLGLAFKENTDDIRESPSLDIAAMLHEQGAVLRGYDPVAMENVARVAPHLHLAESPYELATGADALVVSTPWPEFKSLDMARIHSVMKQPILIDGRNLYDPKLMIELGFKYRGVGRGYRGAMEIAKDNDK
jgi:UDPglucose 6-dehydrogenase